DLNIRLQAIHDNTEYRARLTRLIALSHIVKLSAEDAAWLAPGFPSDTPARALLPVAPRRRLLPTCAPAALALSREHRIPVAAAPAIVADSIGAGDSFNAGFLTSLIRADSLDAPDAAAITAALRLAAKVAAITISRPGADPPWAGE